MNSELSEILRARPFAFFTSACSDCTQGSDFDGRQTDGGTCESPDVHTKDCMRRPPDPKSLRLSRVVLRISLVIYAVATRPLLNGAVMTGLCAADIFS